MPSHPNPDSLHVIYISRLAPDEDDRAFGAVCQTARAVNPSMGVGGALLFDGKRFCQWLYGSAEPVSALLTAIALDRRHENFKLLYMGGHDFTPAITSWFSGVVPPSVLDDMDNTKMGSAQVLPMFMNALSAALF
jgi:hypothetical protein